MVWQYLPTLRQLAPTIGFFTAGITLIVVGAHLSFSNIAPQQARTKTRAEFVREYFRKHSGE